MNKLISKIRTVEILRNNETEVKTFEICKNENVGKQLTIMGPIQKKFNVYNLIRRIGKTPFLRSPLRMDKGGFDTIKECEKAIEVRCRIKFYQSGWYKSIETENDENGNLITNWVKRIKTTYDDSNQIINGIKQSFHGNGIQSSLKTYKDRYLHEVKHWHENGFLAYVGKYEDEKREGRHITYSKNGTIERITSFKNDKLDGVSEVWGYTSEADKYFLQNLTTYHNNVRHGLYKAWHGNGELKEESNYYGGKLDGQYKYYDRDGNILKNERYNVGVKKDSQN